MDEIRSLMFSGELKNLSAAVAQDCICSEHKLMSEGVCFFQTEKKPLDSKGNPFHPKKFLSKMPHEGRVPSKGFEPDATSFSSVFQISAWKLSMYSELTGSTRTFPTFTPAKSHMAVKSMIVQL